MAATSKAASGPGPRLPGDPLSSPACVAPRHPAARSPTLPPGTSRGPGVPPSAPHGPEPVRRRHGNAAPRGSGTAFQLAAPPHSCELRARVRVRILVWWLRDTWTLVRAWEGPPHTPPSGPVSLVLPSVCSWRAGHPSRWLKRRASGAPPPPPGPYPLTFGHRGWVCQTVALAVPASRVRHGLLLWA